LDPTKQAFLDVLRGLADPVYAVLDSSAAGSFLDACRTAGQQVEQISDAGPSLVALDANSSMADRLASDGWGEKWGIYIMSKQPLVIVRNHLRRFQTVFSSDGVEFRFRLHQPALARGFLPGLSGEEAKAIFGPITAILAEAERPNELTIYMPGPSGTLQKTIPLNAHLGMAQVS